MSETTYERMKRVILATTVGRLDPKIIQQNTLWTDLCINQSDELDLVYALDEEFVREFHDWLPVHAWGKGHTLQQMAAIIDRELALKAR